jgi:hypothetical protein
MNVIGLIFVFLILTPLSLLALSALFSALILLFPDPIRQARENLENRPWRSVFLGTLNFIGAGFIAVLVIGLVIAVGRNGTFQSLMTGEYFYGLIYILFGLIGIALAIPTLIGLGAVIILMGERLGKTRTPFLTYLRGGGLLLLACVTPLVGWFVFTPLVIWASLGSVIAILVKPKQIPAKTADDRSSSQTTDAENQASPAAS